LIFNSQSESKTLAPPSHLFHFQLEMEQMEKEQMEMEELKKEQRRRLLKRWGFPPKR
jgi:hypothetical protein